MIPNLWLSSQLLKAICLWPVLYYIAWSQSHICKQHLSVTACSHRRHRHDKTVFICVGGVNTTVSCKLETGSRRDKTHRNWVDTRQISCQRYEHIQLATRQDIFFSSVNKPSACRGEPVSDVLITSQHPNHCTTPYLYHGCRLL